MKKRILQQTLMKFGSYENILKTYTSANWKDQEIDKFLNTYDHSWAYIQKNVLQDMIESLSFFPAHVGFG
jgi:S-formylglutathione hydrolase FrmB